MMRSFFFLLASAVFVLSACSSAGDSSPAIGGTYTGSYTSFTNGYQGTISVVLPNVVSESAFSWSATGSVDVNGSASPVSMSGTGEYVFPDILFTIAGSGSGSDRTLFGTVGSGGASITASQTTVLQGTATEERFDVTL